MHFEANAQTRVPASQPVIFRARLATLLVWSKINESTEWRAATFVGRSASVVRERGPRMRHRLQPFTYFRHTFAVTSRNDFPEGCTMWLYYL